MHNLHQLQSFASVAATGSVRSAADFLGLSPSAVSHHVRLLEQETGLTLFQRHGRGLRLTDTGSTVLPEVEEVLESAGRLRQRIGELRDNRMNRLTIGYFGTAGNRWLPDLVSYLENRFPRTAVRLRLMEGPWQGLEADIQLAISDSAEPGFPVQVHSDLLIADPYVVAVPDDHELADCEEVPITELADRSWIDNDIGDGVCRTIFLDACARAGVRARFRHQAHSYVTALHMVGRGLGLTVLPQLGVYPLPEGVRIVRLAHPVPTRYVHALSDPGHPQRPLIREAIAALRDLATDDVV